MTRTLIIEQSDAFRQALMSLLGLQFLSMTFEEARNGKEALQKISARLPQLILMDFNLPGESGPEVAKRIRAAYCRAPIIMLTSYDMPEYREAAMACGANYVVPKDTSTAEQILRLVDSIVTGPAEVEMAGSGASWTKVPGGQMSKW